MSHPSPSVDEITALVHTFYERVQRDEELGPVFDRRIDDWGPHLDRMVLFWRSVLRGESLFKASERGAPPLLHRQINELSTGHFERWLELFSATTLETLPPADAKRAMESATRIGDVLSRHLNPSPTRLV
jgi:hemoglobin